MSAVSDSRIEESSHDDRRSQVQIMACTADEDAVGYLNDIDEKFGEVTAPGKQDRKLQARNLGGGCHG